MASHQARAEVDLPRRGQQRSLHDGSTAIHSPAATGERDVGASPDDVIEHIAGIHVYAIHKDLGTCAASREDKFPRHVEDELGARDSGGNEDLLTRENYVAHTDHVNTGTARDGGHSQR